MSPQRNSFNDRVGRHEHFGQLRQMITGTYYTPYKPVSDYPTISDYACCPSTLANPVTSRIFPCRYIDSTHQDAAWVASVNNNDMNNDVQFCSTNLLVTIQFTEIEGHAL